MKPYELPTVNEETTPDEAKAALDRIRAAAGCDSSHPFLNRSHPQHKIMRETVEALSETYALREPDPTPFSEALAAHAEKREVLAQEIDAELEALENLGVEPAETPGDDVQTYQLVGLRMQRMAAGEDYDSLLCMVESELCRNAGPYDLWTALSDFREARKSRAPDLRGQAERLIERVIVATKRKNEGNRK